MPSDLAAEGRENFMENQKPWTLDDLVGHLRDSCGVKVGDIVIVHSSMKAVGNTEGSVVTAVKALKTAVGPEGTLLLPVFSNPRPDGIFNVRRVPSRVGLITDAFRRSEGVRRSLHPTHSVAAWGRRAEELLAGHDKTSGLGVDSPFHKAAKAGAYVLMMGCDMRTLSLIHVSEAVVRVPYLGKVCYPGYDRALTLIDYEGNAHQVPPRDVPTDSAAFLVVQNELDRRGQIRRCRVGSAETMRFDAMTCLNLAIELLRKNPAVLLCQNPRCPVCAPARKLVEEALKR
jgi:aminoglycoside 3-N-acetyltransferase